MRDDQQLRDRTAADQVLLNDPLESRRIALTVPGALRVDDGDRATLADPQAIELAAQDPALLGQAELSQAPLEKFPGGEPTLAVAALWLGLVAAEKDVPSADQDPDACRDSVFGGGSHFPDP